MNAMLKEEEKAQIKEALAKSKRLEKFEELVKSSEEAIARTQKDYHLCLGIFQRSVLLTLGAILRALMFIATEFLEKSPA